ncbi:MMPL family transporter [Kribbella koreensis]|uniref:MMPL family transporter n=1 Tax=Kribbella koreensis TaxID=57909 RepID=A0ABN1PHT6_9ACTN
MFHRIGRAVVRHPIWTILAWVFVAAAVVATAPSLPSSSDESSFLPKSYESIQAAELQQSAFPSSFTPSAIVLYQRADGGKLTPEDLKAAAGITTQLGAKKIDQVEQVVPGPPSKDGKYVMGLVSMNDETAGQPKQMDAAKALRNDAKELTKGTQLEAKLGGSAAQGLDQQESSNRANVLTFVGTFVIILLTLLIIFRSPILAVLPLVVLLALVSTTANALIADASKLFGLEANSSISALLIVVLLGVGTDYYLFLMFRYRERLRAGDEPKQAMINAVGRVGEAIASAAGAVMISFLALLLSTLGFLQQMGPALAISVAVTLIAALTLFPAVCSLIPPKALFWPSKQSWRKEPTNARFAALGRGVQRRPGLYAAVSGVIMVALALGTLGFKATFDLAAGSMPETKESMVVQSEMQSSYSAGAAEPTSVLLTSGSAIDQAALPAYEKKLGAVSGVADVSPAALSKDGKTANITVTLKYGSATDAALDVVGDVRDVAHAEAPPGTKALVGGMTSIFKDINAAVNHDYRTVFPLAALLIMVILGLLLRSIVAPWYLMASVGLGFAATLGATVLIFQRGQGHSGLMFMLPVIMYLFVVAIGTDYNILMISRLREEAREGREPREAASMAIRHAGPTVAAAGFILAATFATLMLAGNSLLTEMGFAVSFGIVVAAFVMAMFFTPALTALIGHAAWWPGRQDQKSSLTPAPADAEPRPLDFSAKT